MKALSDSQIQFLKNHNIPSSALFDADGLKKKEYKLRMKELGKKIAYNVTPCRKEKHTLRNRSGHCVQCNPAYLEFQKRNDSSGIIYIAYTATMDLIKVGYSKSVETRSESLNRTMYAGFSDWVLKFCIKSKYAGKIEHEISSKLKSYSYKTDYNHDGHMQEANELYECSYSVAKGLLIKLCKTNNYDFEIVKNT